MAKPTRNKRVKVAIIQDSPIFLDKKNTISKFRTLCQSAAKKGAKLCLFPEAFLGGYPKGSDFGVCVGNRQDEGRKEYSIYYENSFTPSDMKTIAKIAQETKMFLVVGVIERSGATLYCTVFYYSSAGTLLGKHRKLNPTGAERLIWGAGDGSTLPVINTEIGRVAAAICWENYLPLLRSTYYSLGVEIYCAPTVDDRDSWIPTMKHIAAEGRCFVLSACQYFSRSDIKAMQLRIRPDFKKDPLIRGGSCVFGPLGETIVAPDYDRKKVIIAELDLSAITKAKFDLDVAGHSSRSDIFNLQVDTRRKKTLNSRSQKT